MSGEKTNDNPSAGEQTLVSHLIELRARMLKALACVLSIFIALSFFAGDIYSLVAKPLLEHLAPGTGMIATEVASTFIAPIKLTFFLSFFISMPYILYQVWSFVAPGLYQSERRFALPLLISSIFLFYAGVVFAFYVIFPLIFGFFTAIAPDGVSVMTDISRYLDFIMMIFFAFGLAFEVPIVTVLLTWSGITTVESLKQNRPYIIVGAFVIGMLLTPPDVLSQILLALPIWLLFELGLIISGRYTRPANKDNENNVNN